LIFKQNKVFFYKFFYLFLFIFIYFYFIVNSIFFKLLYRYIIIFIFLYTFLSTFLYLNKSIQYGKYTSVIQRFWKRSYLIFWTIELFLFIIFLFISLIHYSESKYFLDWRYCYEIYSDNVINFFYIFTIIYLLLFMHILKIFFYKYNNMLFLNILFLATLFLYINILNLEFTKFFFMINYIYDDVLIFDFIISDSLLNLTEKRRTMHFYLILLSLIKFWHVIFIFGMYIFSLRFFLIKKISISIDLISANIQNIIFLFIFHSFSLFLFFKNYFLFFWNISYLNVFLNINFLCVINYVFYEVILLLSNIF